jgi:hypothetical protein
MRDEPHQAVFVVSLLANVSEAAGVNFLGGRNRDFPRVLVEPRGYGENSFSSLEGYGLIPIHTRLAGGRQTGTIPAGHRG